MPRFSQVFLKDSAVCARIAGAVKGADFDRVVEIGPGAGALTSVLYPRYGKKLTAVEIDRNLVPELKKKFPGLDIINADFLRLDTEKLTAGAKTAFIGNLPYDCSTGILDAVLDCRDIACAVFMFQKEVARRITAVPGTAEYGFLTLCSGMRASAELVCDVRPGSFRPVPAVDSSVLFFRPSRYFSERERELDFIKTVKCSFAHRRKTLANSLALCGFDRQKTEKALSACGIDKKSRAQELTFEQYAALSGTLCAD